MAVALPAVVDETFFDAPKQIYETVNISYWFFKLGYTGRWLSHSVIGSGNHFYSG